MQISRKQTGLIQCPPGRLSENQFAQSARPHFAGEIDMDLGHVARYAPQIQSIPPQPVTHILDKAFSDSLPCLSECCFYCFANFRHVLGGLESCYDIALSVNKELCEVPLDVGLVAVLFIVRVCKLL